MARTLVNDDLQSVINDLTSTLAMVAKDFRDRVDTIATAGSVEADDVDGTTLCDAAIGILDQQKTRLSYFPGDLFHEPAWNMLIALFVAHHQKLTMNVKALTAYAGTPATTSLRWVDHLHDRGLIDRTTDIADRRRVEVSLSDSGLTAMTNYLTEISRRR